MKRIKELADALLKGEITPKTFRSALIAQVSMLSDEDTRVLAQSAVHEFER